MAKTNPTPRFRIPAICVSASIAILAAAVLPPSARALSVDDASFVSQSVPGSISAGSSVSVSVTMKNVGTSTWASSRGYFLGSTTGTTWGITRVDLIPGESIQPGRSKTFSFPITAPAVASVYPFQWRMQRGTTPFGNASFRVSISVGGSAPPPPPPPPPPGSPDDAAFVSQSAPSTMTPGSTASVAITMSNTGTTTWRSFSGYKIGSQNPAGNSTWGLASASLGLFDSVGPGGKKTFSFSIKAPASPGTYNFQWRMLDGSTGFGDLTPNVAVVVGVQNAAVTNWLQFNFDSQHSGNNPVETVLNASNVSGLKQLFQVTLPSTADGAPAFLAGVSTPGGIRDLLYLTTKAGHILALDAHSGASVWSRQYGPGSCKINNGLNACYTTSSPAIDPSLAYVYGYGLDGAVHKYQTGDGTEILTGGWPETTTLKGFDEKGSSALAIASAPGGTYLYATSGGYPGDNGDYQGHVTAIDLATGAQNVFNANCSDQTVHFARSPGTPDCYAPGSSSTLVQTAIWARAGVVYEPHLNKIFMGTGNGPFDGGNVSAPNHEWGDSVFALNADGTGAAGRPVDSYTPTNFQQLDNNDADLGSTAPAVLPSPYSGGILGVQSGKDADVRLLNLSNLSDQGGPGHVGGELQILVLPQGGGVLTAPAVWVNPADGSTWCFIANGSGISAFKLVFSAGVPSLSTQWTKTPGASSPIVANGVLYAASGSNLRAMNPLTGSVLWSSSAVGGIHWESPIVVNGILYCADESSRLTAFSLP